MRFNKRKQNEKKNQIIILIVAVFSLTFFQIIRFFFNNSLIDSRQYSVLNNINTFLNSGFSLTNINLIEIIIGFYPNPIMLMRIIPVILGVLSILLYYKILSKLKVSKRIILVSCLFLAISPPFIYTFSVYYSFCFVIFFNLLSINFILEKKHIQSFLTLLPILFINLPSIFLSLILIFIFGYIKKADKIKLRNYSLLTLFFSIIVFLSLYTLRFIPNKLFFLHKSYLSDAISDLGADIGFSIFFLILAVIGLGIFWKSNKKSRNMIIILLLSFFILSFFSMVLIIVNFILAYFAAKAAVFLYNKKWEIINLKNIALMLVVYCLLFSAISYENRLIKSSPGIDDVNALENLKEEDSGVILSHPFLGQYIKYYSDMDVVIDDSYTLMKGGETLFDDVNRIFSSRDLDDTMFLLKKYNVDYIFINDEMKQGLVWEKNDDGLLFLLHNSGNFLKIIENPNAEVWMVVTDS